ncbi:MAG: RNA methyltransferase [Bacteroidetes bacterium]|nr:RNA methyltransferase [Bacteroidota bacterium]
MLSRARLHAISQLSRRRERDEQGVLLLEGVRSVEAALDAGADLVELVVSAEAAELPRVHALAARTAAPVHTAATRDLDRISSVETSQGVVAVARQPSPADLSAARRVLALDGVQDPGNVGTLVRTAAWFGLDAVVAGPGTADLFSPKVVRSAMGGLWDVPLVRAADLAETLRAWRGEDGRVAGATMDGQDAAAWQPAERTVLVVGSEGHGLCPEVTALLDDPITIPGSPRRRGAESLNVGVAGGVLLWRLTAGA